MRRHANPHLPKPEAVPVTEIVKLTTTLDETQADLEDLSANEASIIETYIGLANPTAAIVASKLNLSTATVYNTLRRPHVQQILRQRRAALNSLLAVRSQEHAARIFDHAMNKVEKLFEEGTDLSMKDALSAVETMGGFLDMGPKANAALGKLQQGSNVQINVGITPEMLARAREKAGSRSDILEGEIL